MTRARSHPRRSWSAPRTPSRVVPLDQRQSLTVDYVLFDERMLRQEASLRRRASPLSAPPRAVDLRSTNARLPLVFATLSQAWPALLIAGTALTLVVLANCAVYRTVRRHERLVRVL